MKGLFPDVQTPEAFDRIARDEAELRPGIEAIHRALGLSEPVSRFAGGSLPVYAVGEKLVLKVYPPIYFDEREREAAVLGVLHERLPIPTPAVLVWTNAGSSRSRTSLRRTRSTPRRPNASFTPR